MGRNKLLMETDGMPLIARTVEVYLKSEAAKVIVVLGYEREKMQQVLAGHAIELVFNSSFSLGKATSIAAGIRALPDSAPGAMFAQADMPFIRVETVNRLFDTFEPGKGSIVVPAYGGKMGSPKIFDRKHFLKLLELKGDSTGMSVIREKPENILLVDVEDRGVLLDIDTSDQLAERIE